MQHVQTGALAGMNRDAFYKLRLDRIESPLRNLVKLLRDNGFNTTGSCGHLPQPYVEMDWRRDEDITKLSNLLMQNGYNSFVISAVLQNVPEEKAQEKHITVSFPLKMRLAKEREIRDTISV